MPSCPRLSRNTGTEILSSTERVLSAAEDCKFSGICDDVGHPDAGGEKEGACKPEGIAVELADVILRTLDLMAALGVDVDAVVMAKHRYNLGREYRHGGKTI